MRCLWRMAPLMLLMGLAGLSVAATTEAAGFAAGVVTTVILLGLFANAVLRSTIDRRS